MNLVKGDKVVVIAGKYKGKPGTIQKDKRTQMVALLKSMPQLMLLTSCWLTQRPKSQQRLATKKSRVKKSAMLRPAVQCYKEES